MMGEGVGLCNGLQAYYKLLEEKLQSPAILDSHFMPKM